VGFPYSYLAMSNIPNNYNAETIEEGYSLTEFQNQACIIDKVSFTGILKEISIDQSINQHKNKKDK
jgi:hypothetical protein